MKRVVSCAAALALSMLAASSAVGSHGIEPVYQVYYYNNAAHDEVVGFAQGDCTWYGASNYLVWGTYSNHPEQVLMAYCDHGIWYPI